MHGGGFFSPSVGSNRWETAPKGNPYGGKRAVDYFQIDSMLTEDESRFRDRVRDFVDEECMPVIADHFDRGTFPMQLIPRMVDLGLFGLHVDGYGCKKARHTVYGLVCQELGRSIVA